MAIKRAVEIWRDFETDGSPPSGAHKPIKPDIREWGTWLEDRTAASIADLKASAPSEAGQSAYMTDPGKEGMFVWKLGDYSAQVAADPNNALYVKSDSIPASTGAWVRQKESDIQATWFGVAPTGDSRSKLQSALDNSKAVAPLAIDSSAVVGGDLILGQDSTTRGGAGKVLSFTGYSSTGSLMKTVEPNSSAAASIKQDIVIENLEFDGTNYPAIATFAIVSGTISTVVLPAGASSVNDFYTGRYLQFLEGVNAATFTTITAYNGATKTATLADTITAPAAGDDVQIGWNDNFLGFVAGISNVYVRGCKFSNLPASKMVPGAAGGKGVNFESGVTNGIVSDCTFDNLTTAVFFQGVDGSNGNGTKKRVVGTRFTNSHASNCGSLFTAAGINTTQPPDADSDDSMMLASDLTYENCGHAPLRVVGTDQQKSGVINLLEAQNVSIVNVLGRNDTTYPATAPGYPTDYASRVGYGQGSVNSGVIGAMIFGHGRNIKVNGFTHFGNVDRVVQVERNRALGDDAAGQGGQPRNCYGWEFDNINLHGSCQYVIGIDANAGMQVPAGELSGRMQVTVASVTSGICDPAMASFDSIIVDVTERSTNKRIVGNPKQIIAAGNTFTAMLHQTTIFNQSFSIAMADDTIYEYVPPFLSGFVKWCIAPGQPGGVSWSGRVFFNLHTTPICEDAGIPAGVTLGTTALTNGTTDGVDGNMNVSAILAGTKIQWKNRRGGSRIVQITWET